MNHDVSDFAALGNSASLGKYLTDVQMVLSDEDKQDCAEVKLGDWVGVVFGLREKNGDITDSVAAFSFNWFAAGTRKDEDAISEDDVREQVETIQVVPKKIGWEIAKLFIVTAFSPCFSEDGLDDTKKPLSPKQALETLLKQGVPPDEYMDRVKVLNVFFGIPIAFADPEKVMDLHLSESLLIYDKTAEESLK